MLLYMRTRYDARRMDDFLGIPRDSYVADNSLCFAIRDGFPVSEGHTLVIPRRKVPDWFSATREEQVAILDLRKSDFREVCLDSTSALR